MTYLEYTGMEGASARVITKAVKALSITSTKFLGVTVTGDIARVLFLDQPSTADQEAVDALIATYNPPAPLVRVKLQKAAQIDDKTRGLTTDGFEYGGKTFPTTFPDQIELNALALVRNHPSLVYPIEWSTENNVSTIQLADATEVLAFYMAYYQTYRGHVESGLALKAQVRAATSIAEVLDIEDDR